MSKELEDEDPCKSAFAEQLVGKGDFAANIATQLMRNGKDEIEAVRSALRILEAVEFALVDLRNGGNIESGLAKCIGVWRDRDALAAIPYEYKTDDSGNRLPVPLDNGLSELMPNIKSSGERIQRFRDWLAFDLVEQLRADIRRMEEQKDPGKLVESFPLRVKKRQLLEELNDPQVMLDTADLQITGMRERGIPVGMFERARSKFRRWRDQRISEERSGFGTKGAEEKKKRQKSA